MTKIAKKDTKTTKKEKGRKNLKNMLNERIATRKNCRYKNIAEDTSKK